MIAFNLSRKQIRKEYWRKQNEEKLKEQNEREKKRDWRLLMVKPMSKRIYLFAGLWAPQKLANSRACGGEITRKRRGTRRWNDAPNPKNALADWFLTWQLRQIGQKIKDTLADWFLIWQSRQIGQKIKDTLADRFLIWRSSANWVTQKDGPTASEIQVGVLSFNG